MHIFSVYSALLYLCSFLMIIFYIKTLPQANKQSIHRNNLNEITQYIRKGFFQIIGPYTKVISACLIMTFILFHIFKMYVGHFILNIGLMIFGFCVIAILGVLTTRFFISHINLVYIRYGHSFDTMYRWTQGVGFLFVMGWVVISLINLYLIFMLVRIGIDHNLSVTIQTFLSNMKILSMNDSLSINTIVAGFLFIPYSFGSIIYSFLFQSIKGPMTTAADEAGDIIMYTQYDLPEDDIRNPGLINDFVGDQIKKTYSGTLIIISTLNILISFVVIFGTFFSLMEGLNVTTFFAGYSTLIASSFFIYGLVMVGSRFFKVMPTNIMTYHTLFSFVYIIIKIALVGVLFLVVDVKGAYSQYSIIGIVGGASIFFSGLLLTRATSKITTWMVKDAEKGLISLILKGFAYSFFITSVIAIIYCIIIEKSFIISGKELNVLRDLNGILFVTVELFLISLVAMPSFISNGTIDNIASLSNTLSLDDHDDLHTLHKFGQSQTLITKIMMLSCFVLISLPVIYNSLNLLTDYYLRYFQLTLQDFSITKSMYRYEIILSELSINFLNPQFLIGLIMGIISLFLLSVFQIYKSSKFASRIQNILNKQLKDQPGILNQDLLPEFNQFIQDVNLKRKWEKLLHFILICTTLITIWCIIEFAGAYAFVISAISTGFLLIIFFLIAGHLWTNTKYYLEHVQKQRHTTAHINAIFADKLGDIFKDDLASSLCEFLKFILYFFIFSLNIIFLITVVN